MIPLGFVFLVFLTAGILFTGWPRHVRDFTIDACEKGRYGFWIARNMMLRRVTKPGYVVELRLIGIVCILGAVVCAWIFFAPKQH
jgi:hypothetical protein